MSDTTTAPAAADAATQAALERLNTVIDRLIAPDGCPWDNTQTPESLTEYVIEECHELVDAIRSGKTADMVEELGDVAFLILMIGKLMARAGGRPRRRSKSKPPRWYAAIPRFQHDL
ncbi:MAG: MazG nucleotide pyrophosphohydrolase domain-containing protein [Bilophila wadsworthia]